MSDFLSALSQKESTNNLGAINSFGYLGMWQMGEAALIDAGFIQNDGMYDNNYEVYAWTDYARSNGVSSYGEFLNSFSAQHIAVQIYHSKLEEAMRKNGAWSYIGQDISGVKITVTGLLAAAHLVGATAVKNWLRNGIVAGDANGVTSQDYANLFKSMHFSRYKEITDNHGKSIYYTEFNPEGTQTRKHNTWISSDGITKYSENRDSSDKL